MKSFLFRPKPTAGECLSSYIHRVSSANYGTNHDLWRLFLPLNTHYPQASMSAELDICPNPIFEISKYEKTLGFEEGFLASLTFLPVFKKLGIPTEKAANSRALGDLIERYRKFCPDCLREKSVYKLIWQVKEVKTCHIHGTVLLSKCPSCNRKIPILPSDTSIGLCPNCNFELSKSVSNKYCSTSNDTRILQDWIYLLDSAKGILHPIDTFSSEQNLALRVLYFDYREKGRDNGSKDHIKIRSLLQTARNSHSINKFVHLHTILYFTRKHNISLEEFFSMDIPFAYIDEIYAEKRSLKEEYSCVAPWCQSYLKPGSLKRTATSAKEKKNGQRHNYYMYCNKCASEYCIDHNTRQLIERGYFISFAWKKVRNMLSMEYTLKDLSIKLDSPEDRIKRAIIFLAANKLLPVDNNIPIEIPAYHQDNIINKMKALIASGIPAREVMYQLGLKYNEFLYYWFLPDIYIAYINRGKERPHKTNNDIQKNKLLQSAIEHLLENNTTITIKNVCKYLSICPETLRNWGLLEEIKKFKEMQQKEIREQKRQCYIQKANEIIANAIYHRQLIASDDIYKELGSSRNVIVRNFPDVTQYIYELIKKYKNNTLRSI